MIRAVSNYLSSIPAIFIDGTLYAALAWLLFSQAYLGGDEAAKWISPAIKFWINYGIGSFAAVTGSVKMFRSTAYGEHQQAKKAETTFIVKP
jgi:hypothetical protein